MAPLPGHSRAVAPPNSTSFADPTSPFGPRTVVNVWPQRGPGFTPVRGNGKTAGAGLTPSFCDPDDVVVGVACMFRGFCVFCMSRLFCITIRAIPAMLARNAGEFQNPERRSIKSAPPGPCVVGFARPFVPREERSRSPAKTSTRGKRKWTRRRRAVLGKKFLMDVVAVQATAICDLHVTLPDAKHATELLRRAALGGDVALGGSRRVTKQARHCGLVCDPPTVRSLASRAPFPSRKWIAY